MALNNNKKIDLKYIYIFEVDFLFIYTYFFFFPDTRFCSSFLPVVVLNEPMNQ